MQPSTPVNPFDAFFRHQGFVVLDGGLATALEARGFDLNDDLWSAKVLLESPDDIRDVHLDFLAAGADCIATCTYQACVPAFVRRGLSASEAIDLIGLSVQLAIDARDRFWAESRNHVGRVRPLVAASIGPYAAFLADGSEYTGDYEVSEDELEVFHRERLHLLAQSNADILAFETVPSRREAQVLLRLLRLVPGSWAWISFVCKDGEYLSDGSRLADVVRDCDIQEQFAAVGVNCTSPADVPALIGELRRATTKPIAVYPNSGERYEASNRTWIGDSPRADWCTMPAEWARLGASVIGGCCRVGPREIAMVRDQLRN